MKGSCVYVGIKLTFLDHRLELSHFSNPLYSRQTYITYIYSIHYHKNSFVSKNKMESLKIQVQNHKNTFFFVLLELYNKFIMNPNLLLVFQSLYTRCKEKHNISNKKVLLRIYSLIFSQ